MNTITPEQNRRTKKMMLWFAMISISMTFAGLTSAYVVSSARADWLTDFVMPQSFIWSTVVLVLSSFVFHNTKTAVRQGNITLAVTLTGATVVMAVVFIIGQFMGFNSIIASGYYFTGAQSSITTSFIYVLVLLHMAHLFAGIIVLLVVFYKLLKNKYTPANYLGLELAVLFWHFLDILWLYLFFFVLLYN